MDQKFITTYSLLKQRKDITQTLLTLPYDGSPEMKEISNKKYLYIRKRVNGKLKSTYVDIYSDSLYKQLQDNYQLQRELKRRLKVIESELAKLSYVQNKLSSETKTIINYSQKNLKTIIFNQSSLIGIKANVYQTESIVENEIVLNVRTSDVQRLLNIKYAWNFVLDEDIITLPTDINILSGISERINYGHIDYAGRIRNVPIELKDTKYSPIIPVDKEVKETINAIISKKDIIDNAIELFLYLLKTQIFNDNNLITALIFINHYLISQKVGTLSIRSKHIVRFKELLDKYYEDLNPKAITDFIKKHCILTYQKIQEE